MKIDSIKRYLRPQKIMGRKSTVKGAFASALAPHDHFSPSAVSEGIAILEQDPAADLLCVYCDQPATTWDHVFNLVVNGEFSGYGHRVRNLVPCCHICNERKGGRNWRVWLDTVGSADAQSKAARIERFLQPLEAQRLSPDALKHNAKDEMKRYLEIRHLIFELFKEADQLATVIRQKANAETEQ